MNATLSTFKSTFTLLDVKRGRAKLRKLLEKPEKVRVPVVIRGYVTGVWSRDDGISQEFEVSGIDLEFGEPEALR
jgi:hypothetical protein